MELLVDGAAAMPAMPVMDDPKGPQSRAFAQQGAWRVRARKRAQLGDPAAPRITTCVDGDGHAAAGGSGHR